MTDRSQLTARKNHLPEITLESEHGPAVLQRPGRALLAFCIHGWSCGECKEAVARLADEADEIASWGCDVALIISGPPQPSPQPLPTTFRVLFDPAGKLDCPGVVIVDEWADVTFRPAAGSDHEFPPLPRIISEIRYLATRCPECEGEAL
jgi:hypothetical protein